ITSHVDVVGTKFSRPQQRPWKAFTSPLGYTPGAVRRGPPAELHEESTRARPARRDVTQVVFPRRFHPIYQPCSGAPWASGGILVVSTYHTSLSADRRTPIGG
ncbi:hypothetical protein PSTG_16249, partial [Puccinia striiformis f. sp. tritici PST-78]